MKKKNLHFSIEYKKSKENSFYLKRDKGIQAVLQCINNDSIDFFNMFRNKRGLIGKILKR